MKKSYTAPWKQYMQNYERLYWQPGKPTANEIKIYYDLIKKALSRSSSKDKKALVLGCTPSIRDGLAKFDVEVTLIDMSKDIFNAMRKLVSHDKKETFVKGNWLDMPFEDNTFDIIVGDCALGNIDAKNKIPFLEEVKRVLKPKSHFIQRIFTYPEDWKVRTTEETLEEFSKMDESCERSSELICSLLYNFYRPKTSEVDSSDVKKALAKYWKDGRYHYNDKKVEKLLNKMYAMYKPLDKVWCTGTKKEVFSWVSKHFDIVEEIHANDHLFAYTFFFIDCKS